MKAVSTKKASLNNVFSALNKYQVRTCAVADLKEDEKHPRVTTDKQAEKAAALIRNISSVPPIIIDKDNAIIAGQEWLNGAKLLGVEKVQVIVVGKLTDDQVRVLRLAYPRIQQDGTWNEEKLIAEFQYLVEVCDIDLHIECTGFEIGEIDFLLNVDKKIGEAENIVPELRQDVVSKASDIWLLGNHTIICGDSRDPEIYKRLLNGTKVQLVCSDPPFNVRIDGFASGKGVVKHEDFAMASGELSTSEFEEFLYQAIFNATDNLTEGGCSYLFMDCRHMSEIQGATRRCQLSPLNLAVWDKGVGGMGSLYRSQHELIFIHRKGKASNRNNVQLGKYGRNRTNVWNYPSANMSQEGREALKDHPTPKPVQMIADIIMDVTKRGDVVLDPFLGGGTAVIAAEKTGRRCVGIELDPAYVDVIVRRWQDFTGQKAVHAITGCEFDNHKKKSARVRIRGEHV